MVLERATELSNTTKTRILRAYVSAPYDKSNWVNVNVRELSKRFTTYALIVLSLPLLFIATGAVQTDVLSSWVSMLPGQGLTVETALRIGDQFIPDQILVIASIFRQ